jgi:hypothetical protein
MSLQEKFKTALAGTSGAGPHGLRVDDGDLHLICEIERLDVLGVTLKRLALATPILAGATMKQLQELSQSLAGRITYLLEPLGPVESDSEQCVVQMRSTPPQRGDDGTKYYELLVRRGGELSLVRYQNDGATGRRPIEATVTREVLLRLVGDFAAVVAD